MNNLFIFDKDITSLTTFGVKAKAKIFAEYSTVKELERIVKSPEFQENQVFHIGGGSNLLIFDYFDGLILHSRIKGIKAYQKNETEYYIIAGAGEKWTDLIDWCIDNGFSGMEFMAGIPGEVGASPVQNVGAYGREASDVIFSVECYDVEKKEVVTLKNEECGFGYRNSRFKKDWKNRYFVLRVSFKLEKSRISRQIEFERLKHFVHTLNHEPTTKEIRDEVIRLRNSKLPDPELIGSAGSFFKNPVIHKNYYEDEVKRLDPMVPSYKVDYRLEKIPAGWLIEHAGLKGYKIGDAAVYDKNCLVIVNNGKATANEVKEVADHVKKVVKERYSIQLYPEVNYIDSKIEVTILGSGTSKGIPEVGCNCRVCCSQDPKDKRFRSSIMLSTMGSDILIDASPDFRLQALTQGINHVDAVLLTHVHYDHVGGLDDLRPFCLESNVPVYCRKDVFEDLSKRLDYCFRKEPYPGVPQFDTHIINDSDFFVNGIRVTPISVKHGKLPIVGFRIGRFAYITDCKTIEESEKEKLKDLEVLIVNALRDRDHFAHLSIEEAVALAKELKPAKTYFTHLCHEAGTHEELCSRLPRDIHPAFDGMKIIF